MSQRAGRGPGFSRACAFFLSPRGFMTQLFFAIDRESKRLTISRREDGALVIAIHEQNNDRVFEVPKEDATRLHDAIRS
jgi:hypothetical protein